MRKTATPYIIFVKLNANNADDLFGYEAGMRIKDLDTDRPALLKYIKSVNVYFPVTEDSSHLFEKFVKSGKYKTREELDEMDPMTTMVVQIDDPRDNEFNTVPVDEYGEDREDDDEQWT